MHLYSFFFLYVCKISLETRANLKDRFSFKNNLISLLIDKGHKFKIM